MSSILQLRDIVKEYKDGQSFRRVLDKVNLDVKAGEFIAIIGPSGCGKTTLLNIAGMMLASDEGEIRISGKLVSNLEKKYWTDIRREKIGFIFQSHQLLPYLKAGEQLSVLLKTKETDVRKFFVELNIDHVIDQYPNRLSGGERQRVAIARAFASQAPLILADEPTASLDAKRGRIAVEMIRMESHKRNKAAVMVSHDERVLDLVDKIYRMEDGKLIQVEN